MMEAIERFRLVSRNCAEIITEEELLNLLKTKDQPVVYIGTAITGRPHIAYFLWVLKLADFLKAGFKVKLLLADLHGALDNCPWELLNKRYEYYTIVIPKLFEVLNQDMKNFQIVKGSDFQKNADYFYDVLRFSTYASIHDSNKAASEVVKQIESPKISGLIYPIMQALDEQYLGVDVQYGGLDQRKILMFAREFLPKIGYKRRVEVMTPIIPGLIGKKMSASDPNSKIDLLDDPETVRKKLAKANCPEGVVEDNGVLAFLKYVVMVIKEDNTQEFVVKRPAKFGGDVSYKTYEELESEFAAKKLHPQDLKTALAEEINRMIEPVRKGMQGKENLIKEAYPIQ